MEELNAVRQLVAEIIRPIVVDAINEAMPKAENKNEKRYYSRAEVCGMLHISNPTFYNHVNQGTIKIVKIGNRTLVEADALDQAIQSKEIVRYKHRTNRRF